MVIVIVLSSHLSLIRLGKPFQKPKLFFFLAHESPAPIYPKINRSMSEPPTQPPALQPPRLTAAQTRALFDILTHNETYSEIVAFKYPQGVLNYGYPFYNKERARAEERQGPEKNGTASASQKRNGSIGGVSGFAARLWGRSSSSSSTPTSSATDTDQPPPSEALSTLSLEQKEGAGDAGNGENAPLKPHQSEMPILQLLMSTFVMQLPAINTLSVEFWEVRLRGLLSRFADAQLSESYEKGTMGARKTLATGWSSVVEMLSRGMLGGVKPRQQQQQAPGGESDKERSKEKQYDIAKGQDLTRAWEDVLDGLVYGDLVDELFAHMAMQPELEEYSSAVNASSHYIVIQYVFLPCFPNLNLNHREKIKYR